MVERLADCHAPGPQIVRFTTTHEAKFQELRRNIADARKTIPKKAHGHGVRRHVRLLRPSRPMAPVTCRGWQSPARRIATCFADSSRARRSFWCLRSQKYSVRRSVCTQRAPLSSSSTASTSPSRSWSGFGVPGFRGSCAAAQRARRTGTAECGCMPGGQGVAGSNPAVPTIFPDSLGTNLGPRAPLIRR